MAIRITPAQSIGDPPKISADPPRAARYHPALKNAMSAEESILDDIDDYTEALELMSPDTAAHASYMARKQAAEMALERVRKDIGVLRTAPPETLAAEEERLTSEYGALALPGGTYDYPGRRRTRLAARADQRDAEKTNSYGTAQKDYEEYKAKVSGM